MTTIHDIVLGPALASRACGDCVACCQVLNIDEPDMVKPADQLCMHCTGAGCGIYATRPNVCREWDCVWRRIDTMPLETRPDRCEVLWTIDRQAEPRSPFDRIYFVARAVGDPTKLQAQPMLDTASMLAHGPLPIFVTWDNERRMIYPREELAQAILDPDNARAQLVEEGEAWMARFTPFANLADQATASGRNA